MRKDFVRVCKAAVALLAISAAGTFGFYILWSSILTPPQSLQQAAIKILSGIITVLLALFLTGPTCIALAWFGYGRKSKYASNTALLLTGAASGLLILVLTGDKFRPPVSPNAPFGEVILSFVMLPVAGLITGYGLGRLNKWNLFSVQYWNVEGDITKGSNGESAANE